MVTVPRGGGREVAKTFGGPGAKALATAWARDRAAEFRLRLRSIAVDPGATVPLVADYLQDLKARGRSVRHLDDAGTVLRRLAVAVPDLATVDAALRLGRFVNGLQWGKKAQAVSPATRNKYLANIRALCRWALRLGRLLLDPSAHIGKAKLPSFLKPHFNLDELRVLARAVDDPYHLRFALGLYAGLRSAETVGLAWARVDWSGRVLDVTGKGRKQRLTPICAELSTILVHSRTDARAAARSHVLPDAQRRSDSVWQRRQFRAFCERCAIDPGERTPHSLRHCYAALCTATGVPSILLQAFMGHEAVVTTEIGRAHV